MAKQKLDLSHIDWADVAERFRGGARLTVLAAEIGCSWNRVWQELYDRGCDPQVVKAARDRIRAATGREATAAEVNAELAAHPDPAGRGPAPATPAKLETVAAAIQKHISRRLDSNRRSYEDASARMAAATAALSEPGIEAISRATRGLHQASQDVVGYGTRLAVWNEIAAEIRDCGTTPLPIALRAIRRRLSARISNLATATEGRSSDPFLEARDATVKAATLAALTEAVEFDRGRARRARPPPADPPCPTATAQTGRPAAAASLRRGVPEHPLRDTDVPEGATVRFGTLVCELHPVTGRPLIFLAVPGAGHRTHLCPWRHGWPVDTSVRSWQRSRCGSGRLAWPGPGPPGDLAADDRGGRRRVSGMASPLECTFA